MFTIQETPVPLLSFGTIFTAVIWLVAVAITVLIYLDITSNLKEKIQCTAVTVIISIVLGVRINVVDRTLIYDNQPLTNITVVDSTRKLSPIETFFDTRIDNTSDLVNQLNAHLTQSEKENIVQLNATGKQYRIELETKTETIEKSQPNGVIIQQKPKIHYTIKEMSH